MHDTGMPVTPAPCVVLRIKFNIIQTVVTHEMSDMTAESLLSIPSATAQLVIQGVLLQAGAVASSSSAMYAIGSIALQWPQAT
jgi:hypothetical protein